MLEIKILTAYPEIFPGTLGHSILGKALEEKKWSLDIVNLHDFGIDERKNIDDEPFGGGPGMVIRADVVENALLSIDYPKDLKRQLIYLTPSGKPLKQSNLLEFIEFNQLIILCGRFEGVDERAIKILNFMELSIGDYVLVGGEIASQVLVEGCIRLLPGVLGQPESLLEESFSSNLLEYPQYTRPQVWKDAQNNDHDVPEILLSGHHEKIKEWRKDKSIKKTQLVRPDLLEQKKKQE
ncbi:MAG: tRNA (guanosine(37)-N1)-methyltransferase TrmD [Alphaproteobacteria bacterium]|jgi:tRNA (guanine37-N1)-methyltransferase|nr:tRNA (guanosine(37)-N1)-methyltransferase TrmD [Alphaproteobacteria bacterium]|tara:strand:+ start:388 stop:1101 length:714 start_codon:yes stop_codon:yes gene_type:complete